MAVVAAPAATFSNPIVEAAPGTGSADPSVVLFRGYYYYCRALGDARSASHGRGASRTSAPRRW